MDELARKSSLKLAYENISGKIFFCIGIPFFLYLNYTSDESSNLLYAVILLLFLMFIYDIFLSIVYLLHSKNEIHGIDDKQIIFEKSGIKFSKDWDIVKNATVSSLRGLLILQFTDGSEVIILLSKYNDSKSLLKEIEEHLTSNFIQLRKHP